MGLLSGIQTDFVTVFKTLIGTGIIWIFTLSLYRLTLHPLAKYPGPLIAKLTTFYGVYHAYVGDLHLEIERLHKKYGTFVRYGPNALLVSGPDGFHDIYDAGKPLRKADSYVIHGEGNVLGLRDKGQHARKKRIFGQGFSDAAIRESEPKLIETVNLFCEKISEGTSQSSDSKGWSTAKNMTDWCNYLTTDIISKAIFTTTWDLLSSTKNHIVVEATTTIVAFVGIAHQSAILYKFPFLLFLLFPKIASSRPQLRQSTREMIARRIKLGEENPDMKDMFGLFQTATDPESPDGRPLAKEDVRVNSGQLIVAGSDTSAAALAATFFYLSLNPDHYAKVAKEVRSAFSSLDEIRAGPKLNNCIYLKSALAEALRLTPVATQPFWREVEAGGASIAGEFIPAGLNVASTIYNLQHNEKVFPNAYEYNPERWVPRNDSAKEKERLKEMNRNYAPFSVGSRVCLAKNFAQLELWLTMANVFWRFDFEKVGTLGEGGLGMGKGRERVGEFQFKCYLTSHTEGPMIRFRKREGR